jgi:hypothetical protein
VGWVGEDGIFPGLLQHGIEIIIGHITKMFAACLAYGYIPLAWRAVRVIFRPKLYIRAGPLKYIPLMESQYAERQIH